MGLVVQRVADVRRQRRCFNESLRREWSHEARHRRCLVTESNHATCDACHVRVSRVMTAARVASRRLCSPRIGQVMRRNSAGVIGVYPCRCDISAMRGGRSCRSLTTGV